MVKEYNSSEFISITSLKRGNKRKMRKKQLKRIKAGIVAMAVVSGVTSGLIAVSAIEKNVANSNDFSSNQSIPTYLTNKDDLMIKSQKVVNVKIADDKNIEAVVENSDRQYGDVGFENLIFLKTESNASSVSNEYQEHNVDISFEEVNTKRSEIKAEEDEQKLKDSEVGVFKEVPNTCNEKKTWMDYTTITAKNTPQYKLQHDEGTVTNEEGFRLHNGEYMVAVGSYYSHDIGTRLRVVLETGKVFYAVVGEAKSDAHTDAKHQHRNGNVIEFIVDDEVIPSICMETGDMSFAEKAGLQGKIKSIEILSKINEEAFN